MEKRVAVVTGAGKGIGRAISIAYAMQGIKVYCIGPTAQSFSLMRRDL